MKREDKYLNLFQMLNKVRECDALRSKEVQDALKIKELMTLTNTVEEKIVLQKDIRPCNNNN